MRDEPTFAPRFGGTPVTWWLIGANAFLWFVYAGALGWGGGRGGLFRFIHEELALHPDQVLGSWKVWQPFTAMWLHDPGGLGHVFFNMLFLFFFGTHVERMLGPRDYLRLYLRAGLVCTLSLLPWYWITRDATPAVGASGAVYGVGVFLAFRQPSMQVIFIVIRMPLWVLVGVVMVGFEILRLVVMAQATGATIGHLSGAAYGWVHHRWLARPDLGGARGPGLLERWREAARTRRAERTRAEDAAVRARVDELLARIHAEGIGSLSPDEKDFLQRASKRFGSG
jgi:membrane associated rhomboid family serine protease